MYALPKLFSTIVFLGLLLDAISHPLAASHLSSVHALPSSHELLLVVYSQNPSVVQVSVVQLMPSLQSASLAHSWKRTQSEGAEFGTVEG